MNRGPGGEKMTRAQRVNNVPHEDDAQSELELEMAASGRKDAVPRHEPTGPGSDVAPTKRAEERERERHRLERDLGRTPAGEEGLLHDRRAPGVSREALDEAAREADRRVVGHELPKRST